MSATCGRPAHVELRERQAETEGERRLKAADPHTLSLGLQIAQNRLCLCTFGPKVGIMYILGARGYTLEYLPMFLWRYI